jgi:quercetin dioxygenase-like cupin family protein
MSTFFYDKDIPLTEIEPGKFSRKVRAYSDKLMIVDVFFTDGGIGAGHSHPHTQAAYCVEGEFEFTVGSETTIVRAGDSVSIPSGVIHGCRLLSPKGRILDVFTPMREDFI